MFESCVFMNRVISKYSASPHLNLVQAVFYFEFSHVIFGSYQITHVESSYLGFSTFQHFLHVHIPILNFSCVIFGSHQGEIFFPIMFESYNCVFVSSNIFLLFSVSCILLFWIFLHHLWLTSEQGNSPFIFFYLFFLNQGIVQINRFWVSLFFLIIFIVNCQVFVTHSELWNEKASSFSFCITDKFILFQCATLCYVFL